MIGRSEIRKLLDRLVFSRVSLFWLLDLLQGELSRPAKAYRLTYSHGACKAWAWVRFILGGSLLPRHTETFFIRGRGDKFTVDSDISISISILSYYPIMLLYSESRGYTISYIRFLDPQFTVLLPTGAPFPSDGLFALMEEFSSSSGFYQGLEGFCIWPFSWGLLLLAV